MIEINLVPDIKQALIKARRIRATVIMFSIILGIVSVTVVALLSSYVYVAQNVRNGLADDEIKKESTKLLNVTDISKTVTIQNQLSKISTLNSSKMMDSRIFDMIVAIVPPAPNNIMISSISIDATAGSITMDGHAPSGYAALEIFKKTIERANFKYDDVDGKPQTALLVPNMKSIQSKDANYGTDSSGAKVLRFSASFEYAKEFFAPSSKKVSVYITGGGDVTDSYLNFPKSIFAAPAVEIKENK